MFLGTAIGGEKESLNKNWKAEYQELKTWRDKNQLPFSDEKLERIAKHHPRIDKWVEIQEHKYGISGVLSVLKQKERKKEKEEKEIKTKQRILNSGKGADPDAW